MFNFCNSPIWVNYDILFIIFHIIHYSYKKEHHLKIKQSQKRDFNVNTEMFTLYKNKWKLSIYITFYQGFTSIPKCSLLPAHYNNHFANQF